MSVRPACLIVVSHRNSSQVETLLTSLCRCESVELIRVVVVHNDHSAPRLKSEVIQSCRARSLSVEEVTPGENLGYFGAAQFALAHFADVTLSSFVIVSNPDIEFRDAGWIRQLLSTSYDDDTGVIGPTIMSIAAGHEQNPMLLHRPSHFAMHWRKWILGTWLTMNLYQLLSRSRALIRGVLRQPVRKLSATRIYAAHGSFLIFTSNWFSRGLDFSHPVFLFNEEIEVAERARQAGLAIEWWPAVRVWHLEHVTTGLIRSRITARYTREATSYVADHHFPLWRQ